MKNRLKKVSYILVLASVLALLSGCGVADLPWIWVKPQAKTENAPDAEAGEKADEDPDALYTVNENGEIEMTEEQMYKLLEEYGYGDGVDWANQSDDDPSIPKSMDITASRELIKDTYYAQYPKAKEYEPGDMYEKAWWDYIPDSYDLTGDVFPATRNYAGQEKQYNNSLEQTVIDGLTTGQNHDLGNVEYVAKSFIYEEMKNKYKWTANLDELTEIAKGLDAADFWVKISDRPYFDRDMELVNPSFMTSYFEQRTVGYDTIGLPQFGGYKFSITVWEDKDKPVGWVNDMTDGSFMNEDEVYENMGEWDFYDEIDATSDPKKVEKPKVPNGVLINQGKTTGLAKEQYIHKKLGFKSGMVYYYGNGITVDMSYFGGDQGGTFEDALKYCRIICGN